MVETAPASHGAGSRCAIVRIGISYPVPSVVACWDLVLIQAKIDAAAIQPHSMSEREEIIERPLMPFAPITSFAASIADWVAFASQSASISRSFLAAFAMSGSPSRLACGSSLVSRDRWRDSANGLEAGRFDLFHLHPSLT